MREIRSSGFMRGGECSGELDNTGPFNHLISMSRDGELLIIDSRGHHTTCRRLLKTELPGWYLEVMADAAWR